MLRSSRKDVESHRTARSTSAGELPASLTVRFPLYWVNALRGRVTMRVLSALCAVISDQQGDQFLRQFIELKGLSFLFDVHEDLFWRYYSAQAGSIDVNLSLTLETLQECGRCIGIITGQQIGLRALIKNTKRAEHIEQLVMTIASRDSEVQLSSLTILCRMVSHLRKREEKLVAKRPRENSKKMGQWRKMVKKLKRKSIEFAQSIWESLESLQLLLEEKSAWSPIVRLLQEAKGPSATELRTYLFQLINFECTYAANQQGRSKRRVDISMAGVEQALTIIEDQAQREDSMWPQLENEIKGWRDSTSGATQLDDLLESSRKKRKKTIEPQTKKHPNAAYGLSGSMYTAEETDLSTGGVLSSPYEAAYLSNEERADEEGSSTDKEDELSPRQEELRIPQDIYEADLHGSQTTAYVETNGASYSTPQLTQAGGCYAECGDSSSPECEVGDAYVVLNAGGSATETENDEPRAGAYTEHSPTLANEASRSPQKEPTAKQDSNTITASASAPSTSPSPPPPPPPPPASSGGSSSFYTRPIPEINLEQSSNANIYGMMKKQQKAPSSIILPDAAGNSQKTIGITKHDLRSLALPLKKGELWMWSVRVKTDPKTGMSMPQSVFDSVTITVDHDKVTIADKILETWSSQSIEKINRVSEHFHSVANDEMKKKMNDFYHSAPIMINIRLEDIIRVREFRAQRGAGWEGKVGIIIKYRIATDKKNAEISLAVTSIEDQQWWIRAIILNKGMAIDWNEEFQVVLKSHRDELLAPKGRQVTVGELVKQDNFVSSPFNPLLVRGASKPTVKVRDLVQQFTIIAEVIAQIIVDELPLPPSKKLIQPTDLGGVAGGAKYISHGILFKFSIDAAGLYGGDEFAMKATQHEIKGLTAYINYSLHSRFPKTLHFPLMTVIDYKGFRLSATSILPVGTNTIVYGSADGGKTVHNKFHEMSQLMKKAGRAINIKTHPILPMVSNEKLKTARRVLLCGPGDIEGHLGVDGRFYVLDTARVFPPTDPTPGLRGGFLFQLFRPEFVKDYETPLCSDAFSRWGHDPLNPSILRQHNGEARKATRHLLENVIPEFATRLENFFKKVYSPFGEPRIWQLADEDSRMMIVDIHRAGINIRYLGHLRKHITEPILRRWLLMEMVSRVLKNRLRDIMRKTVYRSAEEKDTKEAVATFLHRMLHHPDFWSTTAWRESGQADTASTPDESLDIKQSVSARYPCSLSPQEEQEEWKLKPAMSLGLVFNRVSRLAGLMFSASFEERLWRWSSDPAQDELASLEDMQEELVHISPWVAQLPLVAQFSAKKAERHAERSYESTKKYQEMLLSKAVDQYLTGLEMKSDDCELLLNLASMLNRLADIVTQRLPEYRKEGSDKENQALMRVNRLRHLSERQFQEALQIDATRADILTAYASYLARFPERVAEAQEYFALATQANPFSQDLEKKYKSFIETIEQRSDSNEDPDEADEGATAESKGKNKKKWLSLKAFSGKRLSTSSAILRLSDPSSQFQISAPHSPSLGDSAAAQPSQCNVALSSSSSYHVPPTYAAREDSTERSGLLSAGSSILRRKDKGEKKRSKDEGKKKRTKKIVTKVNRS